MSDLKTTVKALSFENKMEKAVAILLETKSGMTQNVKMGYLIERAGLTMNEYLEAANRATNGQITRDACGQD